MTREATPEHVGTSPRETISTGKKVLFSVMFGLMIGIIFVLIEIGLRMAGYGFDARAFVVPNYMNDIYITNDNLFKKYYPDIALTRPVAYRNMRAINKFSREKTAGTLRGIVVGESTVQGFPFQTNQSFSKITELALAAAGRYDRVEVLNLGLSAITSYCVKDIACKLLSYQPDFLVIYSGHNEYYGTISTTTGGNYFSKNLYLALNEFRFFQLLFDFIGRSSSMIHPHSESKTLMEEQFSQKRTPITPETDQEIATNYIKNIDAIVTTYQRRNIPVIIMEPVCNLYDMPPFSGEKDEERKDFILNYDAVIRRNNYQELEAFYQARLTQKQYDRNANVRYLDALARQTLTGEADLGDFKSAKELDTVPFRVKQSLLEKLRDYCLDNTRNNPGLFFIPLEQIMTQMRGAEVFGNQYFIDHLHFSQAGQRLVSRILAEQVADIFHFTEDEKERVANFYSDDGRIDRTIYYLPACRTAVYRNIKALMNNAPFNQMLVPYQRPDVEGLTETTVDPQLVNLILQAQSMEMDAPIVIAATYAGQGRIDEAQQYIDYYRWIYPGCYRPYLIQARFERAYGKDFNKTLSDYKAAYLLSDKMKDIYEEIRGFLAEQNSDDLFKEIQRFGQPIEEKAE